MSIIPPITDAYIDEIIKASDVYNPTLNKTQGVKLREIKLMRDQIAELKAGTGSLLTPVIYLELVNLIATSSLVPNAQYLLPDYKMFWKVSLTNPDLREAENVEPLLLTAFSVNKLSSEAKSMIYPKDIIHYMIGKLDAANNEGPYDIEDGYWTNSYKGIVPVKGMIFRRSVYLPLIF
jgi:hypothetical protein